MNSNKVTTMPTTIVSARSTALENEVKAKAESLFPYNDPEDINVKLASSANPQKSSWAVSAPRALNAHEKAQFAEVGQPLLSDKYDDDPEQEEEPKTTNKQTLNKQTLNKQTPNKQTPNKQTPTKQTPTKQTPTKQTPTKQTPTKQTPDKHTPDKQKSSAKKDPKKKN